jgi:hypothetical protein
MSEQKTNTFKCIEKYGISPSLLRYMVDNLFYFPEENKDCLELYKLETMKTDLFLFFMAEGRLIHPKDGTETKYQVIYHNTDPTKLKRRQDYTIVKLSFRIAKPEFGIIPTVLVKEVREP